MAKELRSMIGLIDQNEQEKIDKEMQKELNDYLICYIVIGDNDEETKEWEIIEGKSTAIKFVKGLVEANTIDLERSFILVDTENVTLSERLTLLEFIEYVNKTLDDPICI